MKRLIALLILLTVAFATSRTPALYHAYKDTRFNFDRGLLCAFTDPAQSESRIPGIAIEKEKEYPMILSDPERYEGRAEPACESATVMSHIVDRAKAIVLTIHNSIKSIVP